MAHVGIPWGFAGGWAIDLMIGRASRPHDDIDIAVFRQDQTALYDRLSGADWSVVRDGRTECWKGSRLEAPVHELRARWTDGLQLEFLLNERDGQLWRYRRDSRVTAPVGEVLVSHGRHPALAPAIVLLFKSKSVRPKDHADFAAALPMLSTEARRWLKHALSLTDSEHSWLSALQ